MTPSRDTLVKTLCFRFATDRHAVRAAARLAEYYVMELLRRLTQQELVKRFGAQPEEREIHILPQICGSLQEAHAAGLLHRHIKPCNLVRHRFAADLKRCLTDGWEHSPDPLPGGSERTETLRIA